MASARAASPSRVCIRHSTHPSSRKPVLPHHTHTPQIHEQTQPTHTMFTQVAVLLVALCTVAHGETWDLSTACKESVVRYAAKQTNLATKMLVLLDTCSPTSTEYNADTCATDVPTTVLLSLECDAEAITALVECKEAVMTVKRQSDVQQEGGMIVLDGAGVINLMDIANRFNNEVDEKEKQVEDVFTTEGFENSRAVLLMQQMMNEWSFMVGLSSSLTKTITDAMKGNVQNI